MTGKELASMMRNNSGSVLIPMMLPDDIHWIPALKKDLVKWAVDQGDKETGLSLLPHNCGYYLDAIQTTKVTS